MDIARGIYESRIFLTFLSRKIPENEGNPHHAEVTVTIDDVQTRIPAVRMDGGQVLEIANSDSEPIIGALKMGKEVTLSTFVYRRTFHPSGFHRRYEQFSR
jgi:hypothetical protein